MTQGGNHGGADEEERAAAMIMAAKKPLYYAPLLRGAGCGQSQGVQELFAGAGRGAGQDTCVESKDADTGEGLAILAADPSRSVLGKGGGNDSSSSSHMRRWHVDLLGEKAAASVHGHHHHHDSHHGHSTAIEPSKMESWLGRADSVVQQVDLTPTLSMLLGLPSPHGSVGQVVPGLLWDDSDARRLTDLAEHGKHMAGSSNSLDAACQACNQARV